MKPALAWNGRGRDKTKGIHCAPQRTKDNAPPLRANAALNDARNLIPKSIFSRTNGRELPRKPRIALYWHDAMGLGYMRRNLLSAQTLAGFDIHRNTATLRALFGIPDPARIEAVGGVR